MTDPTEAGPPPAPERRRCARHPCPVPATVLYALPPSYRLDSGRLRDLSASGVGLLLDGAPEPGAVLFLHWPAWAPSGIGTRLARVAHVRQEAGGGYLVGCALTPPLSEGEVDSFRRRLGEPA
jgi:hypothetical protein